MAKLLLIVAGFIIAWWILKIYRKSLMKKGTPPTPAVPEDMVRCARCGVHLPRGESTMGNGKYFCSEEHRRLDG